MKLIHFTSGITINGSTDPDPNLKLSLGKVNFTCTSCNDKATVNFDNMLFRSLEFYCLSCGTPFKIVNPAFNIKRK
jgi:hypothetical protein